MTTTKSVSLAVVRPPTKGIADDGPDSDRDDTDAGSNDRDVGAESGRNADDRRQNRETDRPG